MCINVMLLDLLTARDIEKYVAVHRKGHRKPRLSEPLVATLKQNVQSPIRIIRPSPTPISPSYKAKAQTNVSLCTHIYVPACSQSHSDLLILHTVFAQS